MRWATDVLLHTFRVIKIYLPARVVNVRCFNASLVLHTRGGPGSSTPGSPGIPIRTGGKETKVYSKQYNPCYTLTKAKTGPLSHFQKYLSKSMAESAALVFTDIGNGTNMRSVSTVLTDCHEYSNSESTLGNQRNGGKPSVMKIASHSLRVVEPFIMPTSTLVGGVGPNQDTSPEKMNGRLQEKSDHVNQVLVCRKTVVLTCLY